MLRITVLSRPVKESRLTNAAAIATVLSFLLALSHSGSIGPEADGPSPPPTPTLALVEPVNGQPVSMFVQFRGTTPFSSKHHYLAIETPGSALVVRGPLIVAGRTVSGHATLGTVVTVEGTVFTIYLFATGAFLGRDPQLDRMPEDMAYSTAVAVVRT
jgi:hypothetical protein